MPAKKRYSLEPIVGDKELDAERVTVRDARAYLLHLAGWRLSDIADAEDVTPRTVQNRIGRAREMIQAEQMYLDAIRSVTRAIPRAISALEDCIAGLPGDKTGGTRLKAARYLLETVGLGPHSMQQSAQRTENAEPIDGQGNTGINELTEDELDNALYAGGKRIVEFIDEKRARRANEVQDVEFQDVTDERSSNT
jgi:hypothetical protein